MASVKNDALLKRSAAAVDFHGMMLESCFGWDGTTSTTVVSDVSATLNSPAKRCKRGTVEGSLNYYDNHMGCGTAADKAIAARLGGHSWRLSRLAIALLLN
jgi:hypothetical protein